MANAKLYARPIGFLYGAVAERAVAEELALPLAGGATAFSAIELIEGEPGSVERRIVAASALAKESARDAYLATLLSRVTAKRPAFAGLSLDKPLLMGIVNVTPDSFSDGGLYDTSEEAIEHAAELAQQGAAIVDIGGESTRPGSDGVDEEDELSRVIPVLEGLKGFRAALSIDTRKASVARAAAKAGARIFNDVSALTFDSESLAAAAETGMSVVLMHAQGEPKTMQDNPTYADVVLEVYDYLERRIEALEAAGIPRASIAADPGLGFGKTLAHNLALISHTSLFHGLGVPLLIGASRKRFINGIAGGELPASREPGSQAVAVAAAAQGAQLFRVHDVAATRQALEVFRASMLGTEN
jgi:dihydropteroate synthase